MSPEAPMMTRAEALTIWASARERARYELLAEAARLCRQGRAEEADQFRFAACILEIRAMQERAQAAIRRTAGALSPSQESSRS
jgi:hypothetical protein